MHYEKNDYLKHTKIPPPSAKSITSAINYSQLWQQMQVPAVILTARSLNRFCLFRPESWWYTTRKYAQINSQPVARWRRSAFAQRTRIFPTPQSEHVSTWVALFFLFIIRCVPMVTKTSPYPSPYALPLPAEKSSVRTLYAQFNAGAPQVANINSHRRH